MKRAGEKPRRKRAQAKADAGGPRLMREFSHIVAPGEIRARREGLGLELSAGAEEREALARRLQLLSLECLEGRLRLRAEGAELVCEGHLTARLAQACVVTLAPVAAELERAVSWRFSPKPAELADALEEGDEGALFYEPHGPDLGEALVQELALSLDPWPKAAGARLEKNLWGAEGEAGEGGGAAGEKGGGLAGAGRLRLS